MIQKNIEKVLSNYHFLLGSGVSLARPTILYGGNNLSKINLKIQQLNMADYHKVMYKTNASASYHIAGYGQSYEETLTRVMGETIERFSFMQLHHLFSDEVVIEGTYNDLKNKYKMLDKKFFSIVKDKLELFCNFSESAVYKWIELTNYSDNSKILYPLFLIAGNKNDEKLIMPTMSTGTAVHVTYEEALINAISEALQIDCFMKFWYGKLSLPQVEWRSSVSYGFMKTFKTVFPNEEDFEIIVLDCSLRIKHFYNYITIIKNKKNKPPFLAMGIQGGCNSEYALLRSMMEAASIYVNCQEMYIYKAEYINSLFLDMVKQSYNLDDTFLYWGNYNDLNEKNILLSELISLEKKEMINEKVDSKKEELFYLLDILKKRTNIFSFLEITPPEFLKYGYKCVRLIAPELLPMCLPAASHLNNDFFINRGGIKNDGFPHPLP
jgi:thiazole/oxazole-forming peptide maturase SagD family component